MTFETENDIFDICDQCRLRSDYADMLADLSLRRLHMAHTGFVCVEVLRPSQPNGIMSSVVSLPNHTFTGQA